MRHLVAAISLALLLCLAVACDKAPRGVIPESTMEKLIVDLELADAYIESHYDEFPSDSTRLLLKQSVMAKYGVTPELYDTSLVWYARNMDVYIKVHEKAIARLEGMRGEVTGNAVSTRNNATATTSHLYPSQGDSADLWQGPRRWMLTQGMKSGFVTFDVEPDKEYYRGDRYEFMFALKPLRSSFRTFMAVDYKDGGTAFVSHFSQIDGWNNLSLQTDSTRDVRRIYGYVYYNIVPGDVAYVDSLTLLRTHLNRDIYAAGAGVKTIERVKREPDQPATSAPTAPVGDTLTPPKGHLVPRVAPQATQQPQGTFKPKEGVNKSSATRHVTTSPNAEHLPRR